MRRALSSLDARFMRLALAQARLAARRGEVPVGALIARNDRVVSKARNSMRAQADPSAHAELLAIRAAAKRLGNERLVGCTLYTTLEPCPMCAFACVLARLDRVVWGAPDPKSGGMFSVLKIGTKPAFNHPLTSEGHLLRKESSLLLRRFFRSRRKRTKSR